MSIIKINTYRSNYPRAPRSRYRVIYLAAVMMLFIPTLIAQASLLQREPALPAADNPPSKIWRLVSNRPSDTWQGDKFHGLKSDYQPIYNGNTIGATYTQYNPLFTADTAKTIASQLTGTCTWYWQGGFIPAEVVPGTNYPFTMAVDANASGSGFLGGTVNGYTQNGEGSGSIAFTQVYLDVNGQVRSGHSEVNKNLTLSAGQNEGETRTVTLTCQIDIVTVKIEYIYQLGEAPTPTATITPTKTTTPTKTITPTVTLTPTATLTHTATVPSPTSGPGTFVPPVETGPQGDNNLGGLLGAAGAVAAVAGITLTAAGVAAVIAGAAGQPGNAPAPGQPATSGGGPGSPNLNGGPQDNLNSTFIGRDTPC